MATILHVDMDAFFASVEVSVHPEWRGRPLIVGAGPHERGVVSTCSYEARKYNVHSAMPSRTAYALCPQAIFVRPNMELYERVSAQVFEIFNSFTPYVEAVSIDEAFLDITGSIHLYGSARALAEALQRKIHQQCKITCSVGIAPNRLLAKIGSEQHKPNGLTIMPFEREAIVKFLQPKPISMLWGVGKRTEAVLRQYGFTICGDIQSLSHGELTAILGSANAAKNLKNHALGISDDTINWQGSAEKSVSREWTFAEDESDREKVRAQLLKLVDEVGRRFRRSKRWARTARIKLRNSNFETITRQATFDEPCRDDISFRKKALELFDRELIGSIRLIGFGVADLQESPEPTYPSLFADMEKKSRRKRERLSDALDSLHDRGLL